MNCEVQHVAGNIRYRILIINGEQYILDMERSFWKIIFPFLFWIFPTPVFKVEDHTIVEQLRGIKKEKVNSGQVILLGGIGFVLGQFLTPLMDYFEIKLTSLIYIILLVFALILVSLLYFSINYKRKKKLNDIVKLEKLPRYVLWIRPNSIKLVFKLLASYIFLLGFILLSFISYIQLGNIMMLMIGSVLLFLHLFAIRVTVQKGHTTVRFKDYKKFRFSE